MRGADIVVEASRLSEPAPLLRTAWIEPGAFVVPYGTVSAVELDLLDIMDKVVVDDWGQAGAGPFGALRAHVDGGHPDARDACTPSWARSSPASSPAASRHDETILLWHRGLSLSDIAVGHALLEKAAQHGVGQVLRYA